MYNKNLALGFKRIFNSDYELSWLKNSKDKISFLKIINTRLINIASVHDERLKAHQNILDVINGTNNAINVINPGIHLLDIAQISTKTQIKPSKIMYVLGGTNLYWQPTESVFFQNQMYRSNINRSSRFYNKPLYYFMLNKYGHVEFLWFLSENNKIFADKSIAISGKPVLIDGDIVNPASDILENDMNLLEYWCLEKGDIRHLLWLPRVKDKKGEDSFLGFEYLRRHPELLVPAYLGKEIKIGFDIFKYRKEDLLNTKDFYGIPCVYKDKEYKLNYERGEVVFKKGLKHSLYPHNVIARDFRNDLYFIQFHGRSGVQGPTLERLQKTLKKMNLRDAIITSNGADVFLYDVRNNLYYSQSRDWEKVKTQKDRKVQNLLVVWQK